MKRTLLTALAVLALGGNRNGRKYELPDLYQRS
jgi:hypothetical protein